MAEPRHGIKPIVVEESVGKKAYCQCGLSANLPYCDGSHSREGTGLAPIIVTIEAPEKKAICQCHQSANRPWCDGTHSKLTS